MISRIPGAKQFSFVTTLLAGVVVQQAAKDAPAQEKLNNNTPSSIVQAPKGSIVISNQPDGTKITEEFDSKNLLSKRTTEKLLEQGNVTETTIEYFGKTPAKIITREQKDGLKTRNEFYKNGMIWIVDSTERYKSGKTKIYIQEDYDETTGFLIRKQLTNTSEDGKKRYRETTDSFGLLKRKVATTIIDDDTSHLEIEYYKQGVFTGKEIVDEMNSTKFNDMPPNGKLKVQKKAEILLSAITKNYDVNGIYQGKTIAKRSTDNLTAIYESYDSLNKIFEKETCVLEYRKDKTSGKYITHFANVTIEKFNEESVRINRTKTEYREDGSKKIIDETFSSKGKLQSRITQEEIFAQRVVATRTEEFDKNGKKTKDLQTFESLKK